MLPARREVNLRTMHPLFLIQASGMTQGGPKVLGFEFWQKITKIIIKIYWKQSSCKTAFALGASKRSSPAPRLTTRRFRAKPRVSERTGPKPRGNFRLSMLPHPGETLCASLGTETPKALLTAEYAKSDQNQ